VPGVASGFARYIGLASVPLTSYLVASGPSELFGFMFQQEDVVDASGMPFPTRACLALRHGHDACQADFVAPC